MEAVTLFAALGYRFTGAGEGWAEVTLTVTPSVHNLYGIVHGGVWLIVADSAMGAALATREPVTSRVISAQSDFRWLRPLEGDTLRAHARVLRRGRTLSHSTCDLLDSENRLVAQANGTYVVQPAASSP